MYKNNVKIIIQCLPTLRAIGFNLLLFMSFSLTAQENSFEMAKNFTLKNQFQKNIKLTELRGQVVVLSFWANWCGSCVPLLKNLESIQKINKDRGLTVLAINVEEAGNKRTKFSEKKNVHILFDDYGIVSRLYAVESLPMMVLIDRDGRIRHVLHEEQLNPPHRITNELKVLLDE